MSAEPFGAEPLQEEGTPSDPKPAPPAPRLKIGQDPADYQLMVNSVRDYAIILLDESGHIATWNPGAQRYKGYKAADIIGQHFSRFYPPEAVERGFPDEVLRIAVRDGRFEDEGWRVRQDGSQFWANVVITALRGEAGELRGFVKLTRDFTELHEVQSELRVAEHKLKAANEALAHTNEQLRTLADHDGLTGLKNRRHFEARLHEALSRAQRCRWRSEPAELSLLLLDIDHFKRINDTLGHAGGDEVLKSVAQILLQTFRVSDVVARYGGEEFAVVLFDTGEVGSRLAAERCRAAVEGHAWNASPVTVSLGATTWTGEDAQTFVARADQALYAAKGAGRNRVCHSVELPSEEG